MASIVDTADRIAETLLFPNAMATDAADLLPVANLDALADAGFYGIYGPKEYGGMAADVATVSAAAERLASGCLTTAFVFLQHHSVVRAIASTANAALRGEWLADMCAGRRRVGIALGANRPGPSPLRAEEAPGGWLLDGDVTWVTGWGRIDAVHVAARTDDQRTVRLLMDATAGDTLGVTSQHLVACNASGTVELAFRRHFVPSTRLTLVEPYTPPPANDGGGRQNGSLALGVTRRALMLAGPSALDAELDARRQQLDSATDETMAEARAAAVELALRATAHLIVTQGSRSVLMQDNAQRLGREALFLLVFATRPAIKAGLLRRLVP